VSRFNFVIDSVNIRNYISPCISVKSLLHTSSPTDTPYWDSLNNSH